MSEQHTIDDIGDFRPDWTRKCEVCNAKPVVMATGLCGPCTWGEADTANGDWWGEDSERRYQAALAKARGEPS